MKLVTMTELKNNFSAMLELVKMGKESLMVSEHGTPIVKIIRASGETLGAQEEGVLTRLERSGHLVRGEQPISVPELRKSMPRPKHPVDILSTLLAEREESR